MSKNGLESVKLPVSILSIYRDWAVSTGCTLSGKLSMILERAAMGYIEGRDSVIQQREAEEARKRRR